MVEGPPPTQTHTPFQPQTAAAEPGAPCRLLILSNPGQGCSSCKRAVQTLFTASSGARRVCAHPELMNSCCTWCRPAPALRQSTISLVRTPFQPG